MSDRKQRPGVMIYFDSIRPALKRLDNEQCGTLFRAILDYSEFEEISDLESMTGMVFDLLRPKLDRDAERYEEGREQRQYATYCREAKKKGEQPQSFESWKANVNAGGGLKWTSKGERQEANRLQDNGSSFPSPFNPSAFLVPAHAVVTDADADGVIDMVTGVDGYHPTSENNGPISSDRYKQPSEQDFERMRQEAQEKLAQAFKNREG